MSRVGWCGKSKRNLIHNAKLQLQMYKISLVSSFEMTTFYLPNAVVFSHRTTISDEISANKSGPANRILLRRSSYP